MHFCTSDSRKKHTLNESGCFFEGAGGVDWANSGKNMIDCARWERGVDPRDKNL